MRAPNARDTALRVLVSCRTAGAWADAALRAQLRRTACPDQRRRCAVASSTA